MRRELVVASNPTAYAGGYSFCSLSFADGRDMTYRCSGRACSTARRGVAASELAVCLPVIVLLVLGMIESCTMIFLKQSLTIAAYEGTRTALVPGATSAEVRATCNQILADRRVKGGTVTITPADITTLSPGQYVDVTVSAPCTGNTVVPNKFFGGKTLSAAGSMMIEY